MPASSSSAADQLFAYMQAEYALANAGQVAAIDRYLAFAASALRLLEQARDDLRFHKLKKRLERELPVLTLCASRMVSGELPPASAAGARARRIHRFREKVFR